MAKFRFYKFDECLTCKHLRTWRCVRCETGEFFEEKIGDLDMNDIQLTGEGEDE